MTDDDLLDRYIAERNEALLKSPQALGAFMKKHRLLLPTTFAALEVVFHKSITSVPSLPIEYRRKSKQWLLVRNFHSLDDGDV